MAYQVDWEAGIITIPKTDLTFLSGTSYELDLRAFKLEIWRLSWETNEGLSYPEIITYYPSIAEINQSESILINYDDYSVQFEAGNYLVTLFGAAGNIDLYTIMNGVSTRMAGGTAVTVNATGSGLTQEEHDKLIGVPDAADNAAAVWSYITRDLTQVEFDSNIIKVNGVTVTDINDFKADVSNLSADVNVIEVNGVIVNSVDDFKADLTGIDLSTDVNVIEVNGTAVTSVDDFKADLTEIDLSTIPAAVWAYVSRELTVAAGLTPEQEAKLDAVPTAVENAEAIAGYTRP